MCEIFGVSSKTRVDINEYLKVFFSHSNKHPHGWGLACMEGAKSIWTRICEKGAGFGKGVAG